VAKDAAELRSAGQPGAAVATCNVGNQIASHRIFPRSLL